MLINEKTWDFVRRHAEDDVRKLALQGAKDADVDLQQALQQIAGRQTARKKLPSWAEVEEVVYPPHLNMEQCSSEQTARYKASLAQRLISSCPPSSTTFVDLTGGLGVDFYWLSQGFQQRTYVEQHAGLCAIAEHNFHVLGLPCTVCCCETATYLGKMPHASLVFLDPARRNEHGGRTYGIEDCTPNVLELLPLLLEKADHVLLKLSPMLDWRKAVEDVQRPIASIVSEVHIVSVDNECKELLLVLGTEATDSLHLYCVNSGRTYEIIPTVGMMDSHGGNNGFPRWESSTGPERVSYLYEPNASVMKAGCFDELEVSFPVRQVAQNSHLFLASGEVRDFPGRGFHIEAVSSMNKKELRAALGSTERANISVRNFPMSVDQLRKKLKLKDGGDVYIFATTAQNGDHQLMICRKIS